MIDSNVIWAPAVVSMTAMGYRVAVRWLDTRERAAVAAEQRNERESGALARIEACEAEVKKLAGRIDTWIANNGQRR